MSAVTNIANSEAHHSSESTTASAIGIRGTIVIVGAGPVGVQCALKVHEFNPQARIILYGAEEREPYNRVQLSTFLAGEISSDTLYADGASLDNLPIEQHFGRRIIAIDRNGKHVTDEQGRREKYDQLILATGSRPTWPKIDGLARAGVFTFRDLDDAEKLAARRLRTRHTVIIGGGLLGLETARAMRRFNTKLTVIEHSPRIMFNQLTDAGAECLANQISAQQIDILTGVGVKQVLGKHSVEAVRLADGTELPCDTLIVAAGITPNVDLARNSDLHFGKGIKVNEQMLTNDPSIYAVGECAEINGTVYGIVAPGLEQAAVAASVISGVDARFSEHSNATTLKVLSVPVYSAGEIINSARPIKPYAYVKDDTYRLITVDRGRLAGVVAVGEWDELRHMQELLRKQSRVWPWQRARFQKTGSLSSSNEHSTVVDWPADATICNCLNVNRGDIGKAMASGCKSVEALASETRASSVCGSCRPLLIEILGGIAKPEPSPWYRSVAGISIACLVAALVAFILPGLPYAKTVQAVPDLNWLWTESLYKQISGFTLLGLAIIASLLSVRKRLPEIAWLNYSTWRAAHVGLGIVVLFVLLAHTGFRIGDNLNFLLMTCFLLAATTGALSGVVVASEHRMLPNKAKSLRKIGIWTHLLVMWPLPILLGFHILKTYYF